MHLFFVKLRNISFSLIFAPMNLLQRILYTRFFIRLLHWEYWSFNILYGPISFVWFWLCLKARSLYFFSASNPSIEYGGFVMESKKAIYDIMPEGSYPKTLYVSKQTIPDSLVEQLDEQGFTYPLIGKPDRGARGRGVKKLDNENELIEYAYASQVDFLVQEFVPFPNEVGIFYYRYPDDRSGLISGIVRKEFLSVTGDGVSTIRQLCHKEKRLIVQLKQLQEMYGSKMETILPEGKTEILIPYGNHARGTKFLDESHMAEGEITYMIDRLCRQIRGFYYGRLDIRFNTWEELKEGKNFSIIEINGAGAEPTHMYDPKYSLFYAWREIIRHWKILWRISTSNNRKGIAYLSNREGRTMLRENKELGKILARQHV
jgi:hypothetical protein